MTTDIEKADSRKQQLPSDYSGHAEEFKLLASYSGVAPDEIERHVREVRDKAYAIHNYPCITRPCLLSLYITTRPEYASVVAGLQAGKKFLDVGCFMGQVLRQLAFDGVPAENLAGTDLRQEFIDLGYDLFRDRGRFAALFAAGDIFDVNDTTMQSLDGSFDIVHAASFFHLFEWDDQVRVGERLVRFFKPGVKGLVLGRHRGGRPLPDSRDGEPCAGGGGGRRFHDVESFQRLWDIVGEKTGTKWHVTGSLLDSDEPWFSGAILTFTASQVL